MLSLFVLAILIAITACPGNLFDNIEVILGPNGAVVGAIVTLKALPPVSTDQIVQFQWEFGDGNSAFGNPVSHIYNVGGIQVVTLKIILADGSLLTFSKSIGIGFTKMYWANGASQRMMRANLDGSDAENLVCKSGCTNNNSNLVTPFGIALDLENRKMYWTDQTAKLLMRSDIDGNNSEILLCYTGCANSNSLIIHPESIALDLPNGKIYWTQLFSSAQIVRANLDGTEFEALICQSGCQNIIPGVPNSRGISLDLESGKMYWADFNLNRLMRANLDGSGWEYLLCDSGCSNNNGNIIAPQHTVLDLAKGKLYWMDSSSDRLMRANLDGSESESLLCNSGCANNNTSIHLPIGIALDIVSGKLYWAELISDRLMRANLDGSGSQSLLCNSGCVNNNTNINGPNNIALGH
jgi:hypothetical protein